MPTQALALQQDGFWQGWTSIVGGTFAYQVGSDSSDSTYFLLPKLVTPTGRSSFPLFLMADGLIPSQVQISVRAQRNNPAQTATLNVGFARGLNVAFDGVPNAPSASVTTFTHTFTTNPLTGLAWADGDLDGLEVCVSREASTIGTARIMNVSGVLTYSQARAWRSTASKTSQAA